MMAITFPHIVELVVSEKLVYNAFIALPINFSRALMTLFAALT